MSLLLSRRARLLRLQTISMHGQRFISPSPTQRRLILLMLFSIALALRTFRSIQEIIPNPDVMTFIDQAQALARDPVNTLRVEVFHPLHAAAGLLIHQIVGSAFNDARIGWLWSLRIVGIIAGAWVTLQIFRLARGLGASFWPSIGGSVMWMVGRRTSIYGSDGLSDMLAIALFMESILTVLPNLRPRGSRTMLRLFLSGILSGLAYLTRPEGAAAALLMGMVLILFSLVRRSGARGRFTVFRKARNEWGGTLWGIVALGSGFLFMALPYMVVIGGFTGKKQLLGPVGASGHPWIDAPYMIVRELWETFFWVPWLILLLAIAIKPQFWGRPRLQLMVFLWMGLWVLVMTWLVHHAGYLDGRHTLPLVVLLYGILGLALNVWLRAIRARAISNWGFGRIASLFCLLLIPGIAAFARAPRGEHHYLVNAANYIRKNIARDAIVCDLERLVGFASGRSYARWHGTVDNPRLDELEKIELTHNGAPLVLGRVYYTSIGEIPQSAIGPYREIARFESTATTRRDVYVLYALDGKTRATVPMP